MEILPIVRVALSLEIFKLMGNARGIGLLEVLLVIALVAIILVSVGKLHVTFQRQSNVEIVLQNVEVIQSGASNYFAYLCTNNQPIPSGWQTIEVLNPYLPNINFMNPFGGAPNQTYYFQLIKNPISGIVMVQVELRLGAQYKASQMQTILSAIGIDESNNAVIWQGLPAASNRFMNPTVIGHLKFFRNEMQSQQQLSGCVQ